MADIASADAPFINITMEKSEDQSQLSISSKILWNQNEADPVSVEEGIIEYVHTASFEDVRRLKLNSGGDEIEILIELEFPERKSGRRLNESSRAALRLYVDNKLFFHTEYFGQHSELYTKMPEGADLKFRPQTLKIFFEHFWKFSVSGYYGDNPSNRSNSFQKEYAFSSDIYREKPVDDLYISLMIINELENPEENVETSDIINLAGYFFPHASFGCDTEEGPAYIPTNLYKSGKSLGSCLNNSKKVYEDSMKKNFDAVINQLNNDERVLFEKNQQAWLKMRDSTCDVVELISEEESSENSLKDYCIASMNDSRSQFFNQIINRL